MRISLLVATGSILTTASYADTSLRVRYTTGSDATEVSVASKGARQRIEYQHSIVIQQPDQNRFVQVDPVAKAYTIVPMNAVPAPAGVPQKRGGTVMVSIATTDTGETKQMLDRTARHLKTVTTRQPMPGACDSAQSTSEIDGWYIDLTDEAALPPSNPAGLAELACKDEYQYQSSGEPNTGFPVRYTMTLRQGNQTNGHLNGGAGPVN